jgi:hypothetical protein
MIFHHTKNKGDLGVLKAKCDLFEKGYLTLSPDSEHCPFDIAIWKDGEFKTVQVKYREANDGKIDINFRSAYSTKNGVQSKPVNKSYIDLYCIYCKDTDKCYYFDPKLFKKSATFRVETPKNNQTKGINFLEDYCEVP